MYLICKIYPDELIPTLHFFATKETSKKLLVEVPAAAETLEEMKSPTAALIVAKMVTWKDGLLARMEEADEATPLRNQPNMTKLETSPIS